VSSHRGLSQVHGVLLSDSVPSPRIRIFPNEGDCRPHRTREVVVGAARASLAAVSSLRSSAAVDHHRGVLLCEGNTPSRSPPRCTELISQRGTSSDWSTRAIAVDRRVLAPGTPPTSTRVIMRSTARTAERRQFGARWSEISPASESWRRRQMASVTRAAATRCVPAIRWPGRSRPCHNASDPSWGGQLSVLPIKVHLRADLRPTGSRVSRETLPFAVP